MTEEEMQKRIKELEQEKQQAIALSLRIEGAQAMLQEMLAAVRKQNQSQENHKIISVE